jgi:hippurate hydrolase
VDLGLAAAGGLFGEAATLRLPNPIMGSEDFSRVIQQVPGAMLFLGALTDGRDPMSAPSNHSPLAAFDDRTLPEGAALYAALAAGSLAR